MADTEKRGLVARWLIGKERSEDYARSTLPTSRWGLFWDILKGRFGRLMLVNLLMLVSSFPVVAIIILRYLQIGASGMSGVFGAGLGPSYPYLPDIVGSAEAMLLQSDLVFFSLFIPAGIIAGLGLSGGFYIIRNLIWTEGIFVANDFLRGIKRNFLNVLEAVLVFTVVLFVARVMGDLADLYVAVDAAGAGWMMASKVVGYIIVSFMLLVCLWMISLGISYKQGPWALFRNAVVMTIGTFPQTVFFAALALWPYFLSIFGGLNFIGVIGILFLLLIGFSYSGLVWLDYSQWAFDKYINPSYGIATGRGLYNKESGTMNAAPMTATEEQSTAMREYRRQMALNGRSKLASRPVKPIDDGEELYQLPDSFSREDLRKLRESKEAMEQDVKAYAEEHKDDEQYVAYNKEFDELEAALREEENGKDGKKGKKKDKKVRRPTMLPRK